MFEFETINNISGFEEFGSIFGVTKCLSPKDTHGPLVKTGPTAGQNKSRNKNGRWRKKRSDAGKKRS